MSRLQSQGFNCILVNDGGDEEATALLRELSESSGCELVEQRPNGGKGRAVILGLHHAANLGYSHVLQIDADGQHDTDDVPRLLSLAQRYPQAVITGVPEYDESVPKHRLYSRYITHVWVWIETLSLEIKDSMCGFRIYPVAPVVALSRQVSLGGRMDFDTEILVRLYWRGVRIISLPTRVIYPEQGISNFRLWRDNLVISWMHTRLVFGMLLRLPKLLYWQLRGRDCD
ncbi:glycosyltransferase family 2 protein [Gilvimarinus sp. DA14]|nr:glycosyltransferase family 2 protein [Gilvimarinus sp. DA14]